MANETQVTNMSPEVALMMRRVFRVLNRYMLLMWRLDMAWWFKIAPQYSGQIMVLNHTGHKSGLPRQTPLNYALVDDELYCTAGFGHIAHWYKNIMALPEVEVWLVEGRWRAVAEDVTEQENVLYLLREVLIGSGFAAFAAGINPYTMTDEELTEATRGYRLIHIQREEALTGQDGPGDLAWVWQVATFILLPLALLGLGRFSDAPHA